MVYALNFNLECPFVFVPSAKLGFFFYSAFFSSFVCTG